MAAEVDPTLFEHLDDSPTEADSLPAHKYRKCTDNNTPDLGEKPPTPRSKLVRENARVHFELPEEIPDSQESLDLSDTPNELEDNSFHTEETVVLAQGTQITLKPKPKYVSPKTSLSLVLLIALLLQVRTLTGLAYFKLSFSIRFLNSSLARYSLYPLWILVQHAMDSLQHAGLLISNIVR